MTKSKLGVLVFGLATFFWFLAGLLPLVKGENPNVTFLAVGLLWLVLTAAAAKKNRSGDDKR